MTVDPRNLDPERADPAATQPEPSPYPRAASPRAIWLAVEQPVPAQPGNPPAAYGAASPPGAAHAAVPHAMMLAASADRERAADVLKAGFAEGRLTQAEYNDRVGQVYDSRTYGELAALVGDLPAGPLGGPAHYRHQADGYPVHRPLPPTNSLALASLLCGIGEFVTLGLTAVPAIVLARMARREIRETGERGDGMAIAGQYLGWAGIGLLIGLIAALLAASSVHARTAVPSMQARPASLMPFVTADPPSIQPGGPMAKPGGLVRPGGVIVRPGSLVKP